MFFFMQSMLLYILETNPNNTKLVNVTRLHCDVKGLVLVILPWPFCV